MTIEGSIPWMAPEVGDDEHDFHTGLEANTALMRNFASLGFT